MAGAAVMGVGLLISTNEARNREKRVAKRNEEAKAVERAERASQAATARRQQVREARLRRAEVMNVAAGGGVEQSSAAIAATGALQQQLGTNLGNINTALGFGEAKSISEQNILDASRKSGLEIWSGVASQFGSQFIK
jgi:hypothetical protein